MKIFADYFVSSKNHRIFAPHLGNGALAHLARALDWQSRGNEFDSRMLHKKKHREAGLLLFFYMSVYS